MRVERIPRVYVETSVFGGAFDVEFERASRMFFEQVRERRFHLVTSDIVQREIETAPETVRGLFDEMLVAAEILPISDDVLQLRDAYLDAGVVTPRWSVDALHVASATVARCELIVSWNFRHIVHSEKIPRYNAVNTLQGYGGVAIYSPQEVISYEDEDV